MWSVIIPTLWRGVELDRMLPELESCDQVSEIIIINNRVGAERPHAYSKVKVIDFGRNIYVNPSWNRGIEQANNELVCLLSDDVLFDVSIFGWLTSRLDGFAGPMYLQENINDSQQNDAIIKSDDPILFLRPNIDVPLPQGWGTCIFGLKSLYPKIPEELLIGYGDQWIFDHASKAYGLGGFNVLTRHETSSSLFNPIVENDKSVWKKLKGLEPSVEQLFTYEKIS